MTDILGVIGGMGPMAGVYLCQLITQKTKASTDAEHIDMVLASFPRIPDRTAYLLDKSKPNPADEIIRIGKSLVDQGCTVIAIPCVTSFALYEEYAPHIKANILHMPDETAAHLASLGVKRVGILATDGTVRTGLFQTACQKQGIEAFSPDEAHQKMVMSVIYDQVKAGKPVNMDMFGEICEYMRANGAEKIILGCTELSLVFCGAHPDICVDAMEVLALSCIKSMGKQVR